MSMATPSSPGKSSSLSKPNDDERAIQKPVIRGASASGLHWRDRIRAYFLVHRQVARDSIVRLRAAPSSTLITWLVIAVAVTLPATLAIAVGNAQQLGEKWDGIPKISVYMRLSVQEPAIELLMQRLSDNPEIVHVTYISPTQALLQFEQRSGFDDILDDLDDNPLPSVLVITPELGLTAERSQALAAFLKEQSGVEQVQFDFGWVQRLNLFMDIAGKLILGVAMLCCLGALLVVGNTIRLAIENRRQEIIVVKLVGGTNAFVRRPFLYLGFFYGLGGGVIALIILLLGVFLLGDSVESLAVLYQSDYELQGVGLSDGISLVFCTALVGWLGAWLAVGYHVDHIEPS